MKKLIIILLLSTQLIYAGDNQTDQLSPVLTNQELPFQISVQRTGIIVPGGIHSGANAQYGANYLFIAGRTNGLHGFNDNDDNFPPSQQNKNVIVINVCKKKVYTRSLNESGSGLTQKQIDTLSVTSPQSYQSGNTLYMTGGYGIDTHPTTTFSTKDTLTAIDVPGLINWVTNPKALKSASKFIRQIHDPLFQVTGGEMFQTGNNPTLLIFGQNYFGFYRGSLNGIYTKQVRRFHIIDDGKCLSIKREPSTSRLPSYRRRDLNIIPIIKVDECRNKKTPAYVALSGVFTLNTGIWTVPVEITADGFPHMANPDSKSSFKQAMNNYASPHAELFLSKNDTMYSILFGGITFGFFENGTFMTDTGIPFTNQITAIKRDKNGHYTQHLLPNEYPTILSTQSNPGNRLRFGAGGTFVPAPGIPAYSNGVLKLDKIKERTVIGYIVGGIQSTLANTNTTSDSAASPYIFKVTLTPKCSKCS